jgi:hypothetical protein
MKRAKDLYRAAMLGIVLFWSWGMMVAGCLNLFCIAIDHLGAGFGYPPAAVLFAMTATALGYYSRKVVLFYISRS